jgi:hypothetical protein
VVGIILSRVDAAAGLRAHPDVLEELRVDATTLIADGVTVSVSGVRNESCSNVLRARGWLACSAGWRLLSSVATAGALVAPPAPRPLKVRDTAATCDTEVCEQSRAATSRVYALGAG